MVAASEDSDPAHPALVRSIRRVNELLTLDGAPKVVDRKLTVPVGGWVTRFASSLSLGGHYMATKGTGVVSRQTSRLPKVSARSRSISNWCFG
jgi:hypothetical protein